MFAFDPKLRGFPVLREQVVALYESSNAPHLAIPGKQAGLAQAYLVGLRTATGFSVFIYLYLQETSDCAVYSSKRISPSPDDYRKEEAEAIAFLESMGFIMTSMNFRGLAGPDQDALMRSLPLFLRDPRTSAQSNAKTKAEKPSPVVLLGRILSSF